MEGFEQWQNTGEQHSRWGGAQEQRPQMAAHLPCWRRSKEGRVDGEVWTKLKVEDEFRDGEKPV